MNAGHIEIFALVHNGMNFGGVGKYAAILVANHRLVFPTMFPKFIDDIQIFVGEVVAIVMGDLLGHAEIARGAIEIAGDDIPADSPVGEMIERRHAARERIGVFVGERKRYAKTEMFRDCRHRGNDEQRIVRRYLNRVSQRGVRRAAVDIVNAEHVGDEYAIEQTALE